MSYQPLNLELIKNYVEDNIGDFHQKRIYNLNKLNLKKILKRNLPCVKGLRPIGNIDI